jgi:hypothetical protein
VFDYYEPKFPTPPCHIQFPRFNRLQPCPPGIYFLSQSEIEELRKLIQEFREAVDLAKKIDVLIKNPDCEDPDKAKLLERVERLEHEIEKFTSAKKATKKKYSKKHVRS